MDGFIVLAKDVLAVVVAVRRADNGVGVALGRLGVRQENAGVMIELDRIAERWYGKGRDS